MPEDLPPDDDDDLSTSAANQLMLSHEFLARLEQVQDLENADLEYAHRVLHNPSYLNDRWLSIVEGEMRRRGLITVS